MKTAGAKMKSRLSAEHLLVVRWYVFFFTFQTVYHLLIISSKLELYPSESQSMNNEPFPVQMKR